MLYWIEALNWSGCMFPNRIWMCSFVLLISVFGLGAQSALTDDQVKNFLARCAALSIKKDIEGINVLVTSERLELSAR